MDYKGIIKRNKPDLIQWLHMNTSVLQYVHAKDIITEDQYKHLKQIRDNDERNTELIDMIMDKGAGSCRDFFDILATDKVNESSPHLRQWISTVKASGTSATNAAPGASVAPGASASAAPANNPNNSTSPGGNRKIADNNLFLNKNRSKLISRVKNVVGIADDLDLSDEMRSIVEAKLTEEDKMRKVLEFTNSTRAAELLIQALWQHAGGVMEDLTKEA